MYQKLSEKELEFCEFFNDSVALIENLIPENIDAPSSWDEESKCIELRPYQFGMLSYEYMYADDDRLSPKQNFQNKRKAGYLINIGSRNTGKSFLGFDADMAITLIKYPGEETCVSSFDDDHLVPRVDRISNLVEHHKFFDMYKLKGKKQTVNRKSGITLKNGHLMRKANENITNKQTVGTKYHGMHYKKFVYDEASYMSNAGSDKRVDSKHSFGVIERYFGIPDLRVGSPLGKILKDEANKNFICRLPQYVREDWDAQSKADAIDKYNGESSISYKLNVEGELTEGAYSKFDIKQIKDKCYKLDRTIKFFEVGKENYDTFRNDLIIERSPCEKVYVCSDIGTTGSPSEIIIIFDTGVKFKYTYQISLHKLTAKEQARVFKWIYDKMGSAFIALDCTNADGRDIREYLLDMGVDVEHLSDFRMNKNIEVGLQKDHKGKVLLDDRRKPIIREENTKEFAIQELEKVFYESKIEIPIDQKFLNEFSNFFEKQGARKSWGTSTTDHLLDSFLLFALCQWENMNKALNNKKRRKRCLGTI